MSTIRQLGTYKSAITEALYKDPEIVELLLGDVSGKTKPAIRAEFKDHVKSHLFIEDTVENTWSYIFYDVYLPELHYRLKNVAIKLVCLCHRDILETYDSPVDENGEPKYPGNRVDALAQMVEQRLVDDPEISKEFGIGRLKLDSVQVFNGVHFYGLILDFTDNYDFR